MPRDLPFDDDSAAGDDAGDAAYRIANGVARVSRAGAYVTGGALVAASGTRSGETPAINHDSRNVGWSEVNDPQPDVPSPTLTFPDITPGPVAPNHQVPAVAANAPLNHPDHHGTDAGLFPGFFGSEPSSDPSLTAGYHGIGVGTVDTSGLGLPYEGYDPSAGLGLPVEPAQPSGDFGLPVGTQPGSLFDAQQNFFDAQQNFLHNNVPGMNLPGSNGMHLPGTGGIVDPGAGMGAGNPFEGVGDDGIGIFVKTSWNVDMHAGLDGVWFTSDMKVDVAVGDVYDQYVQFGKDATAGMQNPAGYNGQPAADPHAPNAGAAVPNSPGQPVAGQPGGVDPAAHAPGTVTAATGPAATAPGSPVGVPGSSAGAGSGPSGLPAGPSVPSFGGAPVAPAAVAPIAPMAVAPPAPIVVAAPVVPIAVAPVAVAPVAVAQPVVATPLQTTIQPDVANHPIANLLAMPAGPSPLTAPVANAPTLFDFGRQPALTANGPGSPDHPGSMAAKPLLTDTTGKTPPTVSIPTKVEPGTVLTTQPTVPTKIPTADPGPTKIPVATTQPPVTKVPPVTSDPDAGTTRPQRPSDDSDSHGGPSNTWPSDTDDGPTHAPSVSNPPHTTAPPVTVKPEVPTHEQPTLDVPDPTVPQSIPTQPQLTTQPKLPDAGIKPVKPASDTVDSSHHAVTPIAYDSGLQPLLSVYDGGPSVHDAGFTVHDSGLSSNLMSHSTFGDSSHSMHGVLDHTMLL
ncbi:hypothetical protein [Nocardia jejuensis]|uniref:hypothetical protein n=1 Tax=Nocardia jejuensis TaxID=328049 RepID=UPI00082C2AA4|nr:hypothetical protein [Nocardia jejuensis]